jgi:pimeloyl-ACP methyl ester carboxylesterase
MKHVMLVHGAWHGPWCWDQVTKGLDEAAVPWTAPDLPSCAAASEGAGLVEDVLAVERALDGLPDGASAVLVGHSRGGMVISEAGSHPRVDHLVYLCAFLLEPGEDVGPMVADTVMPVIDIERTPCGPIGTPRGEKAAAVFYNDCSAQDAAWALERVRPMHLGGPPPDPPRVAWRNTPSTYVVCAQDQAIPPEHQRQMARRATIAVEWGTGHSPFLTDPDRVVDLLVGLAT